MALAQRGTRMKRFALIAAFVVLGTVAAGAMVAMLQIRSAQADAQRNAEKAKANEAAALNGERIAKGAEAAAKKALDDLMAAQNQTAEAQAEAQKNAQAAAAEAKAKEAAKAETAAANMTIEEQNKALKERAEGLQAALAKAEVAKKVAEDAKRAAEDAKRGALELNKKLEAAQVALKAENDRLTKLNKGMVKASDLK
jgi:hypothetical protein